ncbi:hypothetical protein NL676_000828 [Syzygium grande]|nr:hypothetical protein NL676_000828 [Syzygium grande]
MEDNDGERSWEQRWWWVVLCRRRPFCGRGGDGGGSELATAIARDGEVWSSLERRLIHLVKVEGWWGASGLARRRRW